jgi:hypothetical protein
MTLRELFDSFTSSPAEAVFPVMLPSAASPRGKIEIRIDNPHGVPAQYAVAGRPRTGWQAINVDVAEQRVGIPTRRMIQLPLDQANTHVDYLVTIRAAGRTSKLVLYRESLAEWLETGTSPEVSAVIESTGAVRFSVSRPTYRHGAA